MQTIRNFKITTERIIIALLLIVVFFLSKCSSSLKREKENIIAQSELDKQTLQTLLNKKGDTIYSQKSIITSSQSVISNLTDSIFDLKKKDRKNRDVIAYYRGRTTTRIDTLEISWVDTLRMKRFEDSVERVCKDVIAYYRDSAIETPHTDSFVTKDIDINFTLKKTDKVPSLLINRLLIVDTLDLQFVEHKRFLRKSKIEVQFVHSNPYIRVDGSNSVFYKPQKKPKLLQKALLIGVGIFIGTKL